MFGNRRHTPMTSLTHDSVRSSALHASTLAVFLLGMIGQGFSPCPHHASLSPSAHATPAVSTGSILGVMTDGHGTPDDSESEDHERVCSCLEACETESGESLPSGQFYPRGTLATVRHVADGLSTSLLDARPNVYLVPLPQPPPFSSNRSS